LESALGVGWVVLELGAELLLAVQRGLCLAALELGCLSGGAFVGELALERRVVLPCALLDPLRALARGALLGFTSELVASLGVLAGAGCLLLGGAGACPRFACLGGGLVAIVLGGACALLCAVAVLLGLFGAR
jgi:hypothetical protein